MINVEKLNKEVQALGLDKIGFIAEALGEDSNDWNCYADPETNGDTFGFDPETCSFRRDTCNFWDSYEIKESTLKDMYDVVLIGRGPVYTVA